MSDKPDPSQSPMGETAKSASDAGATPRGRAKRNENDRVVIKKYANRRLYNTQTSSYVTLDTLSEMVRKGVDFVVFDAKTGDDITRSVLAQIIFDEESKGQNLLPIQFLRQLIGFYGDSVQALLPSYLEMSLDGFSKQQERFREQLTQSFGSTPFAMAPGITIFDDQVKQNLALFDRTMRMFTPFAFANGFGNGFGQPEAANKAATSASTAAPSTDSEINVSDLKSQMQAMQAQLDALAKSTASKTKS